ncbi:MAG: cysteine--tRNA ligase [Candidatus Anammoxibacter sp.]
MVLNIYNTLTRKKEVFKPLEPGRVNMYVCGPTVYGHAHIGHAKSYISFDVIVRFLRHLNYKVRYVQNITDVGHLTDDADQGEDKIAKRAALEKVEPMELVEKYMCSYFEDMDALNIVRPDISPRASGHISEQIELVTTLIEKGYAYEANGSVYFDISKFSAYGKLSGKKLDELEDGVRIEVNPEKKHPADFALWKRAEKEHIMQWNSPWGKGFPGWHLECSVMSMKYLDTTFDIHGGGIENVFPHHECEIAQSESANGQQFVRYWMHNNMVTVNGKKMGKSLGNFVTLKDAFKKFPPLVIRFFVLSTHYRSPMDYSDEALASMEKGMNRLHNTVKIVRERLNRTTEKNTTFDMANYKFSSGMTLDDYRNSFLEAMHDDFNTPKSIGILFDLTRDVNVVIGSDENIDNEFWKEIDSFFSVLGGDVLGIVPDSFTDTHGDNEKQIDDIVNVILNTRKKLREIKNWDLSDDIRKELDDIGITIEDTPNGATWKRQRLNINETS